MLRFELSVILILICASKCLAMSSDELEDFVKFLEKTSQLSPTLKKGAGVLDDDEDEPVSDNAWEESGKFEGDLVLNERQRRLILEEVAEGLSRNGINDGTKRWPNNEVIYYIQKEHFTTDQVQAIHSGIEELVRASCVTFRPYRKGDRDAVVIQGSRRGCFSQVGYQGGYQVLNLFGRHPAGQGCFRHGTVVHELLHTLGFYHMQSSPDRDDFVNIIWKNIMEQARHNFRKYNSFAVSDYGVGYDYQSVLHYSRRAFSVNGQDTIVPKKVGAEIGQRVGLSDKDAQKLNRMYCDSDSNVLNSLADEQATEKTELKKKNNREMPFGGQGIGYHQGKAVVIKLLPAPETYKLPDVPSFHVFDYFSKAPHTPPTPETQVIRTGKEIAYSLNPPEPPTMGKHKNTIYYGNSEIESTKEESKQPEILTNNNSPMRGFEDDRIFRSNEYNDNAQTVIDKTVEDAEDSDPDLINAFDRLSKIITQHVYPSHSLNLNMYKINEDSSISNPLQKKQTDQFTVMPRYQSSVPEGTLKSTAIEYIKKSNNLQPHKSKLENPNDYSDARKEKKSKKARNDFKTDNMDYADKLYEEFPDRVRYDHKHSSLFDYASPQNDNDFYQKVYTPKANHGKDSQYDAHDEGQWYADDFHEEYPYARDSHLPNYFNEKFNENNRDTWKEHGDDENTYKKYYSNPVKSHDYISLNKNPAQVVQKWFKLRR